MGKVVGLIVKKETDITVAELKAQLDEAGIKYDPKAKKNELVELLKEA